VSRPLAPLHSHIDADRVICLVRTTVWDWRSLPPCGGGTGRGVHRVPHDRVSRSQRARAKQLRQTMTRAETLLWRYLKAHRLKGLSFRRQASMGAYIVDFVCHSARFVVEVDGASHDFDSRQRRDHIRDTWLANRGYLVIWFSDEDVLRTLGGVVDRIEEIAQARLRNNTPLPNPPPQGGREQVAVPARLGAA
jgi:very-short-patch-repair endonuclease